MKPITLTLFMFFFINADRLLSQSNRFDYDDYYRKKREIGFNVTNVLANVFNLNSDDTGSPYSVFYRQRLKRSFLRFGTDLLFDNHIEFSNFSDIEVNTQSIALRVGWEKAFPVMKKMMFLYGIDIYGKYFKEKNITTFNQETSNKELSGGIGPAIRLEYKLGDRILISTESTLYFTIGRQNRFSKIDGNIFEDKNSSSHNVAFTVPKALFIAIQF